MSYEKYKVGKKPYVLDKRTLKLSDYLTPKLPAVPIKAGYVEKVRNWPMFLNDQLGDCTVAAAGHMIEQWATYTNKSALISDVEILKAYEHVSGYNPNDPSSDQGAELITVLRYWRKHGIGGHKILAYVSVDPTNQTEVEQAAWLFGNVYVGIQLPLSAQNPAKGSNGKPLLQVAKNGPFGRNEKPGGWGGHCIPIIGFSGDTKGDPGTLIVTWGEVWDMTWSYVNNYVDEMWAVLSLDWLKQNNVAPNGFDFKALKQDLKEIG